MTSAEEHSLLSGVRRDFPILQRKVHGRSLIYLDNAATTQKPRAVLDVIDNYYTDKNANIHRGVHLLSEEATNAYNDARHEIQTFLNARSDSEIIFTRNSTESINLVANSFGRNNIKAGDELLITHREHHSKIV